MELQQGTKSAQSYQGLACVEWVPFIEGNEKVLSHYQDSKPNMHCREGSALMAPKGIK